MSVKLENIADDVSKSKFSFVGNSVSNHDILAVWDTVSSYVEKQLVSNKGVTVKNLGTFTLSITRLDVGNNQFIQMTRPVFIPSAKFLQTHGLSSSQTIPPNDAAVSPINFSALSFETPYTRDIVERCIHEVIAMLENNIRSGNTVDFLFKGIGRLLIGEGRVKMRFFKEFLNNFDKSGRLVKALKGRPGTVDSVMSESAAMVRPSSVANSTTGMKEGASHADAEPLQAIEELPAEAEPVPELHNKYEGCACSCHKHHHDLIDHVTGAEESRADQILGGGDDDVNAIKAEAMEDLGRKPNLTFVPEEPTASVPTAGIVDLTAVRERISYTARHRPLSAQPYCATCARGECLAAKNQSYNAERSNPFIDMPPSLPPLTGPTRPDTCAHSFGGQELCYICYQRARLNQPLDLKPLRKQRDVEEDRMWGDQNKLESTKFKAEQEQRAARSQADAEKTAAFNLGIAEAIRAAKKPHRQPEVCPTFIMPKRTLTPILDQKVVQVKEDCRRQADEKKREEAHRKAEELIAGQIEQLELKKTLSEEKERVDRLRQKQLSDYRTALDEQLHNRDTPIPQRQPDSYEPVFGALDNANAPERRRDAEEIAEEQLDTVAAKRRAEVLRRIQQQREEQLAIKRASSDLNAERTEQFRRAYEARRCLENEWFEATRLKKEREKTQRMRYSTPGLLVHEQCDDYKRCDQCLRRCSNNGRTNIWTDNYYTNGSRYIV